MKLLLQRDKYLGEKARQRVEAPDVSAVLPTIISKMLYLPPDGSYYTSDIQPQRVIWHLSQYIPIHILHLSAFTPIIHNYLQDFA